MRTKWGNNDSYPGIGKGAVDYRSPVKSENRSMKDGSHRGRKPAKDSYKSSANVDESSSRSFQSGRNTGKAPKRSGKGMPYK